MKVVTVVGARPQFIKAAPVSLALQAAGFAEYLLHTGQHYDRQMSQVFFTDLNLPEPAVNLGIGSGSHAQQTAAMLVGIENILLEQKPDFVVVYGDTNSTLAGALAAIKLHIPVAHIEAGLRSFNRQMPEEHNRVITDHCSELLFCPTQTAVENLQREGITQGVQQVGDVMYDAILQYLPLATRRSHILEALEVIEKGYYLVTLHRPANVDDDTRLQHILLSLEKLDQPVIFPLHPRTQSRLINLGLLEPASASQDVPLYLQNSPHKNIIFISPVGYLDMLVLEQHARAILTDSGGVQKEAYLLAVPCLTLRNETEWVETLADGWNQLVEVDLPDLASLLQAAISSPPRTTTPRSVFGDGTAARQIAQGLSAYCAG